MTPRESTETHNLRTALAALRRECREQPPEHLEAALRARFVERRRSKAARRWTLCIASAAVAISAVVFWRPPSSREQAPQKLATAPVAMAHDLIPERPPEVRKQPVAAIREDSTPQAADFLALPYAEPLSPSEPIDVYRVQLPRVTLAQFGLPVRPGTLDSTVTADLVVGSDGVARAIRFVR